MTRFLGALAALLASSPAVAQAPDWHNAARLDINLRSFRYDPSTITLDHGQPYVLHLVNQARGGHNFVAKQFFAAATVAADDRSLLKDGEIEIGGGKAADLHFIAPGPGRYDTHCSHFMHAAFGMKGEIVVR